MPWAGNVAYMGLQRNIYKVLWGKLRQKPLERHMYRWKNNIKINFK